MELFYSGTGNYNGRRTRIVAEEKEPDCAQVLVTRTLTVRQLVNVTNYEPATVQAAREYEIDLPEGDQMDAIVAAAETGTAKDVQFEITVRVEEATPGFTFEQDAQEREARKARGQYQHGQGR